MGGRKIVRLLALLCWLAAGAVAAQEDHAYYGPRLIEEKAYAPY